MESATKSGAKFASQRGFTLAELLVVVAMIGIVAGLSIPSFSRSIDNAKLKAATQKLAAVYQDARLRATQNNTPYQVLASAPGITPSQICLDVDGDGVCGASDPATVFPGQISLISNGFPAGLNQATLGFAPVQQIGALPGIAWNGVGVPCQRSAPGAACGAIVGWVQYLQFQRSGGDVLYGAVTVSPTGRVKTWMYNLSGNGNGNWF